MGLGAGEVLLPLSGAGLVLMPLVVEGVPVAMLELLPMGVGATPEAAGVVAMG